MTREESIAANVVKTAGEMTVRQLIQQLSKCDPEDRVRVHERGSMYDKPISSVQKNWRESVQTTYLLL